MDSRGGTAGARRRRVEYWKGTFGEEQIKVVSEVIRCKDRLCNSKPNCINLI